MLHFRFRRWTAAPHSEIDTQLANLNKAQLSARPIAAIEYPEQELRDARPLTAPAQMQWHTIATTERPFVLSEMLSESTVSSEHEGKVADTLREMTHLQIQASNQVRKEPTAGTALYGVCCVTCGQVALLSASELTRLIGKWSL
jgi:hypothetical protein